MKPAPPVTRIRSPLIGRRLWVGALLLAGGVLSAALLGCGSSEPPRAAEPAVSPPAKAPPAGRVVQIGGEPEGLVLDPASDQLAVGLRAPARLAFVDPKTLAVTGEVRLPGAPRHLAYSAAEGSVIVPAESANAAITVSPGKGITATTPVGTHPHDAVAVGDQTFVADEHSDQISILRDGRPEATVSTPHQPGGIAAVDDRYVVLVAVSARVLAVYDAHSFELLGETQAGVGPSHVVTDGDIAFVADTQGNLVREYKISAEPQQIATAPAPGTPYGLAVDSGRHRLWVTLTRSNTLAEYAITTSGLHQVATYPTVQQPNSVEVDPSNGDVYVVGRTVGQLERIVPGQGATR